MYRYPFTPYPNSWYRIAYSDELPVGGIQRVNYLGEALLVFRGEDGKANVINAYCPHLGADLSAGGKVVGNTIACPFHDWRFDGSGNCVEIPYCDQIPRKAQVKSWPVCEKSGAIYFYYHAEGAAPDFELPEDGPFPDEGSWNKPLKLDWTIRMHIQEVAENAVDTSHFPKVHAYAAQPDIESLETDGPRFTVKLISRRQGLNFVGDAPMTITYHGFGVVHANLTTYLFGRLPITMGVLLTSTPVDEEHVEIKIMSRSKKVFWLLNPLWAGIMRFFSRKEISADFSSDIPIWESKQYLDKPILCKGDGPIGVIRKWARQFYSEGYESSSQLIASDSVSNNIDQAA